MPLFGLGGGRRGRGNRTPAPSPPPAAAGRMGGPDAQMMFMATQTAGPPDGVAAPAAGKPRKVPNRRGMVPPSLPPRRNPGAGVMPLMRKASAALFMPVSNFLQRDAQFPAAPTTDLLQLGSPGPWDVTDDAPFAGDTPGRKETIPLPPPPRALRRGTIPLPPPPRFRKKANGRQPRVEQKITGGGDDDGDGDNFVGNPPLGQHRSSNGPASAEWDNAVWQSESPSPAGVPPSAPPRNFTPPKSLMVNRQTVVPPPPPGGRKKKKPPGNNNNNNNRARNNKNALGRQTVVPPPPPRRKASKLMQQGLRRLASNIPRPLAAKETVYGFGAGERPPPPPPPRGASGRSNKGKGPKRSPGKDPVRGAVRAAGSPNVGAARRPRSAKPTPATAASFLPRAKAQASPSPGQAREGRDWVRVTRGWERQSTLERKIDLVRAKQAKAGTYGAPVARPGNNGTFPRPKPRRNNTLEAGWRPRNNNGGTAPRMQRQATDDSINVTFKSDPDPGLRRLTSKWEFWKKREEEDRALGEWNRTIGKRNKRR